MIEGMEEFVGKRIKKESIEALKGSDESSGYIRTCPDFIGPNTHINMFVYYKDYVITRVDGDKCFSVYRGMYNRSSAVYDRPFTKRELAYFRRFLKTITE